MKLIEKVFFIFFLICVFSKITNAQHPVVELYDDSWEYIRVGKSLYLLEANNGNYDFETILKDSALFKPSSLDAPNFGTTKATVWGMLDINLHSKNPWFLEIDAPWLDTFIVYCPKNGSYEAKFLGRRLPIQNQERRTPDIIYKISPEDFPSDTVLRFYFRANGRVVVLPAFIGTTDAVIRQQFYKVLFYFFYCGIVLMLVIFYLAVFITTGKKENLYYTLWVLSTTYYFAVTKGFLRLVLPESLQFLIYHSVEPTAVAGFMLLLFTSNSLHINEVLPSFKKWFRILMVCMCLIVFLCFIGQDQLALQIFEPLMLVTMAFSLVAGIMVYRKGNNYAIYYTLAFAQTLLNVGIYILVFMKVFHFNTYTSNASLTGTLIETALLSLGLGSKIRGIEREEKRARELVVQTLRENEKIIRQQNEILEIKVNERTHLLEIEKKKSDDLLRNILPEEIAHELKQFGHSKPKVYEMVTIMFTDFKDFTGISERVTPQFLVAEIDNCFSAFDKILGKHGLEKIKTIGDAYLAVCGLPNPNALHAESTVHAALEIVDYIKKRKEEGGLFTIRIGIHSGSVVAGIVGIKKFAYDIWGDTVNLANRMESSSEADKVNISGATYELVKEKFTCIYRGKIEVKNKGMIDMYFVER